jgi:hypothetical protein
VIQETDIGIDGVSYRTDTAKKRICSTDTAKDVLPEMTVVKKDTGAVALWRGS